mmetsp:Transcript_49824/g.108370  ORF Transcript_49824/g.108370 Transcript_49824/m.108370 type:complete len:614 (-) Transcript_49824:135-1976(-)
MGGGGGGDDGGGGGEVGGSGSFWSTFGPSSAMPPMSPLEELLMNADCSVEALLDEEDVIQEFRACNEKLVARLSQPDAAKVLMQLITCEPPEEASNARNFRYPFVAVELMTCGPENFLQAVVQAEDVMDTLWSFLENTKPAEVNPVLAGYFSRAVSSVYGKYPAALARYLQKRGADAVMQRFLERLHLRSLAEFFARLLCIEQPEHRVFSTENIVAQLLDRLKDETSTTTRDLDTQENVTLVVLELLSQKETILYGESLFRQLTSADTVGTLVDQIFGGRRGCVRAATSILSSIVFHADVSPKGGTCSDAQTPQLSPLPPPAVSSSLGDEDLVNVGDEESFPATFSPSPSQSDHLSEGSWLRGRNSCLMQEICNHFPRIRLLLDKALGDDSSVAMPIGTISAIGNTSLEVVNLISMLTRTGHNAILEAILREQLLPRCLELFFRHPWSSLLHNSVKSLVSEVMTSTAGIRQSLIAALLSEGGLAERFIEEYKAEATERADGIRYRHVRVGYMGHLHLMCTELCEYGSRAVQVKDALSQFSGWRDEILPALDATKKTQAEELGGGVPDWDRGLSASGSAISISDSHSQSYTEETDIPSSGAGLDRDEEFELDDL